MLKEDYVQPNFNEFVSFITNNNIESVKAALEAGGIDINQEDSNRMTPLMIAAQNGFIDMAKLLIKHDADINVVRSDDSDTIEFNDAYLKNEEGQIFLDGLEMAEMARPTKGWTALMYAAQGGHTILVDLLLENKADITITNIDNNMAIDLSANDEIRNKIDMTYKQFKLLNEAISSVNFDEFITLLNQVHDINYTNKRGETALMEASEFGNKEKVLALIERGANINAVNKNGATALMCAASFGRTEIISYLLKEGANVNAVAKNGATALMDASSARGNAESVKLLLSAGADWTLKKNSGETAIDFAKNGKIRDLINEYQQNLENLYKAVDSNNLTEAEKLLETGVNVNITLPTDTLHLLVKAASIGNKSLVELLLNYGANIDAISLDHRSVSWTALTSASKHGHLEIVKILLNKGANINTTKINGYTALMCASLEGGNIELVKLLLSAGSDWTLKNTLGETAIDLTKNDQIHNLINEYQTTLANLYNAVKTQDLPRAKELLEETGVNVNIKPPKETLDFLMRAARLGNADLVKLLLNHGANIDAISSASNGCWTALASASRHGYKEIVVLLLNSGADVNINKNNDHIPLMEALRNNYQDIALLLIERGADVNIIAKDGWTPLTYSIKQNFNKIINALIAKKANINEVVLHGYTALTVAAQNGDINLVKLLIENGANTKDLFSNGSTHLHFASQAGNLEVAKYFIEIGYEVDATNNEGWTALMYAASEGQTEVFKYLLEKGAKINKADNTGKTASMLASEKRHDEIHILIELHEEKLIHELFEAINNEALNEVKQLIERGANIKAVKDGETTLMLASRKLNAELVSYLLDKGADFRTDTLEADPNIIDIEADADDRTTINEIINSYARKLTNSMLKAAREGDLGEVQQLIERGVSIDAVDEHGDSALILSSSNGHANIVKYLFKKGANLNYANHDGKNAFMRALDKSHANIVLAFLDKIGTANKNPQEFLDILKSTINSENIEMLELLLQGKNINAVYKIGDSSYTAMELAIKEGKLNIIQYLLNKGACANGIEAKLLIEACLLNSETAIEIVKILISKGADLNAEYNGITPLSSAAQGGNLEIFNYLLDNGAEFNNQKTFHRPLTEASKHNHINIVTKILEKISTFDESYFAELKNALDEASKNGHEDVVKLLLENGADYTAFTSTINENIRSLINEYQEKLYQILESKNYQQKEVLELIRTIVNVNIKPSDKPYSLLMLAALTGDAEVADLLIKKGANIDDTSTNNDDTWTALGLAAQNGELSIVELLIQYGAKVNALNGKNHPPLIEALRNGHDLVAMFLIEKGANINTKDANGETALMISIREKREMIVSEFLKLEVNTKAVNKDGKNALMIAIEKGHKNIITNLLNIEASIKEINIDSVTDSNIRNMLMRHKAKLSEKLINIDYRNHDEAKKEFYNLIEKGADIKVHDAKGSSLLHIAALAENVAVVDYLINDNNIDEVNKDGMTALMLATKADKLNMVKYFVSNGANPNFKRENDGWTALMIAAKEGNKNIAEYLLNNGADFRIVNKDGTSASIIAFHTGSRKNIHILISDHEKKLYESMLDAIEKRNLDQGKLKELIKNGLDINYNSGSFLIHAIKSKNNDLINLLLDNGADINLGAYNHTPLMVAIENDNEPLAKLLIKRGANINTKDASDYTPLTIYATKSKKMTLASDLINEDSDLNMKNTALMIAVEKGFIDLIPFLVEKGADPKLLDKNGSTLLHIAAQKDQYSTIKYLISIGYDVNAVNKNGKTPLGVAIEQGFVDSIQLLIENGANIQELYENGLNLLHIATEDGDLNAIKYFISIGYDVKAVNENGDTPLMIATKSGYKDIVDYLSNNDGKTTINLTSDKKISDLINEDNLVQIAEEIENLEMASYLINIENRVNANNHDGWATLRLAAQNGSPELSKSFISRDEDVNTIAKDGQNLVDIDNKEEDVELTSYLINEKNEISTDNYGSYFMPDAKLVSPLSDEGIDSKAFSSSDIDLSSENEIRELIKDYLENKIAQKAPIENNDVVMVYKEKTVYENPILNSKKIASLLKSATKYKATTKLLELGEDKELAEKILEEAETLGVDKVIEILFSPTNKLFEAIDHNNATKVNELILQNPSLVNSTNADANSALFMAIAFGHNKIANNLLINGAHAPEYQKEKSAVENIWIYNQAKKYLELNPLVNFEFDQQNKALIQDWYNADTLNGFETAPQVNYELALPEQSNSYLLGISALLCIGLHNSIGN